MRKSLDAESFGSLMNTFLKQVGLNLKRIREKRGLKQATLAEKAGCAINSISRYESGVNSPGLEQLVSLAKALDVSPTEILLSLEPSAEIIRIEEVKKAIVQNIYAIQDLDLLESILSYISSLDLSHEIKNSLNKPK